jgi:mycothiol synthase
MGVSRSPDEVRTALEAPGIDPARDICLWEDADGELMAYAMVEIAGEEAPEGTLRFRVHPAARALNLDGEVIRWAEARMRELATGRGVLLRLMSFARADDKPRVFMLEWHHFKPIRYFFQLGRTLDGPIDAPAFPLGFVLRHADPAQDGAGWVEMFNQTFIDHWDHHDLTLAQYMHRRQTDPGYDPRHDLIVSAPEGTFAAFCWSLVNREEMARTGRREALLHQIGVRRGFRQMGLGRATMLAALRALQADGLESVRLYVDADNPTGATRLYESVAFEKQLTLITYTKEVGA